MTALVTFLEEVVRNKGTNRERSEDKTRGMDIANSTSDYWRERNMLSTKEGY